MSHRARRLALAGPAVAALLLVAGFLWFLAVAGAAPADPLRRTDGIAVLTGGQDRVETGFRLLREGLGGQLLISGAHPAATLAELAATELPPPVAARVALGRTATSTRGNAREVAAWAAAPPEGPPLRSIRVVTAGYHMPRALLELRRTLPAAGLAGIELLPYPVVPATLREADALGRPRTWRLLAGEYAKLLLAAAGLSAIAPWLRGLPE